MNRRQIRRSCDSVTSRLSNPNNEPKGCVMNKLALFFACASVCLLAQTPEATITGTVTDPQGAAISGATVVAASQSTGQRTQVESNESGIYVLPSLRIGDYVITVEMQGFKKYVRRGLTLTTGQNLQLDVTLEIGAVTESISVNASASTLETRKSDFTQLVESRTVEDIPLGDRRTMNIINITGAAVFVNYDTGAKPNFSLAGGRTQSQNFFLDGGTVQNMRLGIGQMDTDPPVETIAEVKVLTSSFSAEYGGSAGGVIVAATKSGTNRLRGSAYEYLRNEKLDAGNFFAPFVNGEKVRAPLRYNVFGATLGGPILIPKIYKGKDRTFFFFSYEGSRRKEGFTDQFTVPTELQRTGNFSQTYNASGVVIPIYDPLTNRASGNTTVRDQFPGNVIPAARLDPVAVAAIAAYPLPNRAPDNITGANNYRTNYRQGLYRDALLIKVDHEITAKDRFSARYLYNSDDLSFSTVTAIPGADQRNGADRHQRFFYGQHTRIFTPALINEFRFTYANRINWAKSAGLGEPWAERLGLKGIPNGAFPRLNPAGFYSLGSTAQERQQFPIQQFQWINNLSWVRGRHTYKFGGEARPSFNYETNRPTLAGAFTFSPLGTGLPGVAASGNGLATMLTGFVNGFSSRETEALDRRSWYYGWFVQDDWTVSQTLTLNIGLRWETDSPIVDLHNRMNGFDMNAINPVSGTPGVVRFMGQNGFMTSPYPTDRNNFGPRFGFAWRPFGSTKTVIRGGGGIFFAHPFDAGAPNAASLGYELSASLNSVDNGITPAFYLRNGVPNLNLTKPELNDSFGAVRVGQNPNTAVTFFDPDRATGYSQQWNLTIQREITNGFIVEAGYIANLSRKLPSSNLGINQVRPELLSPSSTQRDRPYPQFTNVTILLPTFGVTNYHALALRAERRFSRGFNLLATYTWSKNLNNTNEGGATLGTDGGTYSNLYNRRADYGYSENDIPHRFTFNSVYELPFGKGRRWMNSSRLRHIAGDWSMSGIVTLQSGPPFTVTTQVNQTFSSTGPLRANVSGNPNLPSGERTLLRWFDTSKFSQPAPATFGNMGVGILRADGAINVDFSLLKNIPLAGEGRKLQFRAESFNIANHPNFGVPGRVFGAPDFGVVRSAFLPRRLQLGLRLVF